MTTTSHAASLVMRSDDIIRLDVGGQCFRTTRSTLCSVDGYFSAMLREGQWKDDKTTEPIFIDRDPLTFPGILSYLRCRKVVFSSQDDSIYLQKLQIEADYYQLVELYEAIEQELHRRHHTEDDVSVVEYSYRVIPASEANSFFNQSWEYVAHFQGNECMACLVSMTGAKVEAMFVHGHCSACGEHMSFEKFCRHTSLIQPSMMVIRRRKKKSATSQSDYINHDGNDNDDPNATNTSIAEILDNLELYS